MVRPQFLGHVELSRVAENGAWTLDMAVPVPCRGQPVRRPGAVIEFIAALVAGGHNVGLWPPTLNSTPMAQWVDPERDNLLTAHRFTESLELAPGKGVSAVIKVSSILLAVDA